MRKPFTQNRETKEMRINEITLTPAHAQELLDTMGANRRIADYYVAQMASDIREGRWVDNGETIKTDHRGRLIDGQHRCAAVVRAGVAIPAILVGNLSERAQGTVDIGRTRTASNTLQIQGVSSAYQVAAIAKMVIQYDKHPERLWSLSEVTPSRTEVTSFAIEHHEHLSHVAAETRRVQQTVKVGLTSYGTFLYLGLRSSFSAEAWAFHQSLISLANLGEGDPRLAFARHVAGSTYSQRSGWDRQRSLAVAIVSLNRYIHDEEARQQLVFRRDQLPMPGIG